MLVYPNTAHVLRDVYFVQSVRYAMVAWGVGLYVLVYIQTSGSILNKGYT